jgi:hypothetical protein
MIIEKNKDLVKNLTDQNVFFINDLRNLLKKT